MNELVWGLGGPLFGGFEGSPLALGRVEVRLAEDTSPHQGGIGCRKCPPNPIRKKLRQLQRAVVPPVINPGPAEHWAGQAINSRGVAVPLRRVLSGGQFSS